MIVSHVTFLGPSLSQKNLIKQLYVIHYEWSQFCMYYNTCLSKYKQMNCTLSSITSMSTIKWTHCPPPFHESPVLKLNIIMVSVLMMNFPPLPLPLSPACTIKPVHKIYLTMTSSVMWKLKIKHLSN